jgi:bifunctional non-homologous end joining protein LigD
LHFEKSAELFSREGRVRTNFEVTEELDELLADRNKVIAVGELHVVDEAGAPVSYPDAVSILRTPTSATQKRIRYAVFDVLEIDGEDYREKPYWDRMEAAKRLFTGKYAFPAVVERDGASEVKRLWKEAVEDHGYEGLVLTFGERYENEERIKVKPLFTQDLIVGGIEVSEAHPNMMGSLILFYMDKDNNYRYAGKVGTGFTMQDRKEWYSFAKANEVNVNA